MNRTTTASPHSHSVDSGAGLGSGRRLLDRLADGEKGALGELHDRFAPRLRVAVNRIVRDRDLTEDVLQETFLQVWRQADRFDPRRGSVSTWLGVIARARALDRCRSLENKRRATRRLIHVERGDSTVTEPAQNGKVLRSERRSRLGDELERIPDAQRTVLRMAFLEGLTHREIAEQLGIPLGTVKTRSRQGLKKLRRRLNGDSRELL